MNETIPYASVTAERKRVFSGVAPMPLACPVSLELVSAHADVLGMLCSSEAVNPHLNLGFQGQVEPVEMDSCIIYGKVMEEQM